VARGEASKFRRLTKRELPAGEKEKVDEVLVAAHLAIVAIADLLLMDRGCGKAQPQQPRRSGTLRLVRWTQPRSVTTMKRCAPFRRRRNLCIAPRGGEPYNCLAMAIAEGN